MRQVAEASARVRLAYACRIGKLSRPGEDRAQVSNLSRVSEQENLISPPARNVAPGSRTD
jgi:hypothetical protein